MARDEIKFTVVPNKLSNREKSFARRNGMTPKAEYFTVSARQGLVRYRKQRVFRTQIEAAKTQLLKMFEK